MREFGPDNWTYDANGKLPAEVLDSFDDAADRTDTFVIDLFGNRRMRTTDMPSTAYVDVVITLRTASTNI